MVLCYWYFSFVPAAFRDTTLLHLPFRRLPHLPLVKPACSDADSCCFMFFSPFWPLAGGAPPARPFLLNFFPSPASWAARGPSEQIICLVVFVSGLSPSPADPGQTFLPLIRSTRTIRNLLPFRFRYLRVPFSPDDS